METVRETEKQTATETEKRQRQKEGDTCLVQRQDVVGGFGA